MLSNCISITGNNYIAALINCNLQPKYKWTMKLPQTDLQWTWIRIMLVFPTDTWKGISSKEMANWLWTCGEKCNWKCICHFGPFMWGGLLLVPLQEGNIHTPFHRVFSKTPTLQILKCLCHWYAAKIDTIRMLICLTHETFVVHYHFLQLSFFNIDHDSFKAVLSTLQTFTANLTEKICCLLIDYRFYK